MQSIVAASPAATDHATARSRIRPASTSRRSATSCLLSFRPRLGRSGDKMTAAANTGPNSEPRPTSSAPATAWKPRARSSRSMVPSHRYLTAACAGRIPTPLGELFAFLEPRGFSFQLAEVVELGAPHLTGAHDVDVIDYAGVQGEDAFHALAEADLAHGHGGAHARILTRDHSSFERLQTLLVTF